MTKIKEELEHAIIDLIVDLNSLKGPRIKRYHRAWERIGQMIVLENDKLCV